MDSNASSPVWVDNAAAAESAMEQIVRAAVAGYDSEFYGVDVTEESCVARSKLDVFSIAIPTERLDSRGFIVPRSFVFEGSLITHGAVRAYLENEGRLKAVHNLSVDSHTARNAGVRLRGCIDTLNFARWVYPERANLLKGKYDLDSLCRWRLDIGKTEDFDDFLGYWVDDEYTEVVTKQRCVGCLELGCRKKKPPHDVKTPEQVEVVRTRKARRHVYLPSIRPDGPNAALFSRYLIYAAVDAELAFILYQMMLIDAQRERHFPYTYAAF